MLETMQGQYNSYGCCFKQMDDQILWKKVPVAQLPVGTAVGSQLSIGTSHSGTCLRVAEIEDGTASLNKFARQPCPVPDNASFEWEAMEWQDIVCLKFPREHREDATDGLASGPHNGIAAYHVHCWQAQLDAADTAELRIVRQRLALANIFNTRLTEPSPIRLLPEELLLSIGEAAAQGAAPRIEPQPIASRRDEDQGWGEYQHPSDCLALHVVFHSLKKRKRAEGGAAGEGAQAG